MFNSVKFNKTLYISPLMVMTDKEYTKHYFIEGERICTKVGGGFRYAPTDPDAVQVQFMGTSTATSVSDDLWTMTIRGVDCSGYPSARVSVKPKLRPARNDASRAESQQYFYHPDHLGSSSFVTDAAGLVEQHMQYLPFGELFVNQQNSSYDTRYKFSAKEHDPETNYLYYGARYMDSDLGMWLSVDPLAHKFYSTSPFMYVCGNPIRIIDPNGMDTVLTPNGTKQNVGEGYIPYENNGKHYLVGEGLDTKIWDSNKQTGHDKPGAYTDYEGDPGFEATAFVQFEARGSFVFTGSMAVGVAFSSDGNAALYKTWSLGGGLAFGSNYGFTGGVMVLGDVGDLEGDGWNLGLFAAVPIYSFAGEINTYWSDEAISSFGASGSIPGFSGGFGVGAYIDYSNTTIISQGSTPVILKQFWGLVHDLQQTGRDINSVDGVPIATWNDFGSK